MRRVRAEWINVYKDNTHAEWKNDIKDLKLEENNSVLTTKTTPGGEMQTVFILIL